MLNTFGKAQIIVFKQITLNQDIVINGTIFNKSYCPKNNLRLNYFYNKKNIVELFLTIVSLFLLSLSSFSQNRVYNTNYITNTTPVIDGVINEEVWNTVEWSSDFVQQQPYEDAEPSQQTAFKVLYDDNNLYFAIKAFDNEPEKIERMLTRRDEFAGDWVGIAIDSYNDDLTGFSFTVNAAGVKSDGIVTNDNNFDETWNPVWYAKVGTDADGWIAEMKIPLTQLRFSKKDEYVWGLELLRQIFRKEELSLWQKIPQNTARWVSLWGELRGIKNIKPIKEIEILPYAMVEYENFEKEEGNPFATGKDYGYNAGLDAKVAITNDFTLNLTVNPDFGQVEADPSEVNLSAFESYFEEKRPFFIEGSNIFNYPLTGGDGPFSSDKLFYSRRIGRRPNYEPETTDGEYINSQPFTRILGAAKLSGKTQKGLSIGILETLTKEEFAEIDSQDQRRKVPIEPMTNYFNTRIQKDFKNGNTTFGGMITATNRFISDSTLEFLPTSAYTGGLDFTNFWDEKSYYFSAKAVISKVNGTKEAITELQESPQRYYQRPDAAHLTFDTTLTSITGSGGTIEGGKIGGGHWSYGGWTTWRSPGLELNDQGYLRGADFANEVIWAGYRLWEPFSIFRSMNFNVAAWLGWDFGGNILYQGLNFNFNTQFKNYWRFGTGISYDGNEYNRSELRGGPALIFPGYVNRWINIGSDNRKKLSASIFASNRSNDNDFAEAVNAGMEIQYRPLDFLQISLSPNFYLENSSVIYIETIDLENGQKRYIASGIKQEFTSLDLRINLSITPDLSIQFWGQPFLFSGDYSDYKKVVDAGNKDIMAQYYSFSTDEINYDGKADIYNVDENVDGQTDYSFENPDFSFFEFRSNLVLRWEYIPGSTAYLVWSQGRTGDHPDGRFSLNKNIERLSMLKASNTFLLKFSYRFSF
ncbi:MAG: hypothetical protein C0598_12325 [Marinilabiliales bacterium]|nr:MAG: hypothetical protein C0598_12325 [Marinilabiliales bacterium]